MAMRRFRAGWARALAVLLLSGLSASAQAEPASTLKAMWDALDACASQAQFPPEAVGSEVTVLLTMKRDGERWKVVAVKDEVLSRRIAETVGQEIVVLAAKGSLTKAGQQLGVENLQDMIKQLEGVFK